jgi:hypothetical protein
MWEPPLCGDGRESRAVSWSTKAPPAFVFLLSCFPDSIASPSERR